MLPRVTPEPPPAFVETTTGEVYDGFQDKDQDMKTVCSECGIPYEEDGAGSCMDCRPRRRWSQESYQIQRGNSTERGYDHQWSKLSKRARARQPFCTDCGSPNDLTADHSVEAWKRRDAGKTIRLRDIDVVCRPCNTERGAARGDGAEDTYRNGGNQVQILDAIVSDPGGSGLTDPLPDPPRQGKICD